MPQNFRAPFQLPIAGSEHSWEQGRILKVHDLKDYPSVKELAFLFLLAFLALLVHGYHPGVEDAEIYGPGIKKLLNPALYSQNSAFFESHAHMTLFPNLIAGSIRLSHLS